MIHDKDSLSFKVKRKNEGGTSMWVREHQRWLYVHNINSPRIGENQVGRVGNIGGGYTNLLITYDSPWIYTQISIYI